MSTLIEDRALSLLGAGLPAEVVANSLGVTPSYISQLLSEETFYTKVTQLRFESLSKHNERDSNYDKLEDKLLEKLENLLPFMVKPLEVLRSLQVINSANRRGSSAPQAITGQQTVINLTIPTKVVQQFTTNIDNQVISAGDKTLVTMQSGSLLHKLRESNEADIKILSSDEEPNNAALKERIERIAATYNN